MAKIIFEKLTIREEDRIQAGETEYPKIGDCHSTIDPVMDGPDCNVTKPHSECVHSSYDPV